MTVRSIILLLLCAMLGTVSAADAKPSKGKSKPKPSASDKKKDKENDSGDGAGAGLESLGSLIPEGVKSTKFVQPSFSDGRPTSVVTGDSLTRLNPKELFIEGLSIRMFGKDEKQNTRVDMKSATYNLDTKVLTSKTRTKVRRSNFTVEGDSAIYDTTTGIGSMKGHVHMVIYDTSGIGPKSDKPKTESQPKAESAAPLALPK